MKVAIFFDSPYAGWSPDDHWERMETENARDYEAEPDMEYQVGQALVNKDHEVLFAGVHGDPADGLALLRDFGPDVVFNATEAFQGDDNLDYLLPALLEAEGHVYTGAPPQGLIVSRNKGMSKKILAHHEVRVPEFHTFRLGDKVDKKLELPFPLIVKPLREDASTGIAQASVVHDMDALVERVAFVHARIGDAIAEQFIEGRELYVSIIGNGPKAELLPTMELVFDKDKNKPEERIATKAAKWDEEHRERKGIKSVFARPISKVAQERLEHACRTAYRTLWLRDYARMDLRLSEDDEVYVLEANANPYVSWGHEVALSAKKAGLDYDDLIERIVMEAKARKGK